MEKVSNTRLNVMIKNLITLASFAAGYFFIAIWLVTIDENLGKSLMWIILSIWAFFFLIPLFNYREEGDINPVDAIGMLVIIMVLGAVINLVINCVVFLLLQGVFPIVIDYPLLLAGMLFLVSGGIKHMINGGRPISDTYRAIWESLRENPG